MADFIIRPSGDSDWANALYLQAPLPVNAQDAAALGLALGVDYQIGEIGTLASFSVTNRPAQMAPPSLVSGTDRITVTLAASPAENGAPISQFDLRYSTDQSNWVQILDITSPHVITSLTTGTTYFVQTRAANANGAGDWSVSTSAQTGVSGPDVTPGPIGSDPTLLTTSGDLVEINGLSITFRLTDDPADVTVANRTAALALLSEYTGNENDASGWPTSSNPSNPLFFGQLNVNDTVTFTVSAPGEYVPTWEPREADHNSNPPNPRRWAPSGGSYILDVAPAAMGVPSLAATQDTITVIFGADPTGGLAPVIGYDVRFAVQGSGQFSTNQNVSDGVVLSGLQSGTAYEVQTRAVNAPAGGGAWSSSGVISTAAGVDDTPPVIDSIALVGTSATLEITEAANQATFFGAGVAAGSLPNAAQIKAGTGGGILEAVSFVATGDTDLDTITLANPLTTELHFFLEDPSGNASPINRALTGISTADVISPVLAALTGTSTGETTADWSVISDDASGVLYVGVRPATATGLTAAQLIAGAGGAGVAFASDTSPLAGQNTGSFGGLVGDVQYQLDAVQVDDAGNQSLVLSSATFSGSITGGGTEVAGANVRAFSPLTWTSATNATPNGDGTASIGQGGSDLGLSKPASTVAADTITYQHDAVHNVRFRVSGGAAGTITLLVRARRDTGFGATDVISVLLDYTTPSGQDFDIEIPANVVASDRTQLTVDDMDFNNAAGNTATVSNFSVVRL